MKVPEGQEGSDCHEDGPNLRRSKECDLFVIDSGGDCRLCTSPKLVRNPKMRLFQRHLLSEYKSHVRDVLKALETTTATKSHAPSAAMAEFV